MCGYASVIIASLLTGTNREGEFVLKICAMCIDLWLMTNYVARPRKMWIPTSHLVFILVSIAVEDIIWYGLILHRLPNSALNLVWKQECLNFSVLLSKASVPCSLRVLRVSRCHDDIQLGEPGLCGFDPPNKIRPPFVSLRSDSLPSQTILSFHLESFCFSSILRLVSEFLKFLMYFI